MEFSHDWFSSFWLAIHFSACFLTVLLFLETISAECDMKHEFAFVVSGLALLQAHELFLSTK
jgi:hypothetical protein